MDNFLGWRIVRMFFAEDVCIYLSSAVDWKNDILREMYIIRSREALMREFSRNEVQQFTSAYIGKINVC